MNYKAHVIACHRLVHEFSHLTLYCPKLAAQALPGHYLDFQNNRLYVLAASPEKLEFILPPLLAHFFQLHTEILLFGLQGRGLKRPQKNQFYLLLLQDEELAAGLFYLKKYRTQFRGLVFIGAQAHFPFKPVPSHILVTGIPPHIIAALSLLEQWGIANRLASQLEQPGVFQGTVQDLKQIWLQHKSALNLSSYLEILIR